MPKTSSKTSTASKSTTSNGKRNGKPEMTREQIVVRATVLYKKHGEKVAAEKLNEEGVPTLRASRTRDNGWHSDALRGLMARTGSYVASRTPKKATPAASSKRSTTTKRASSKRASAKRTSSKRSSSKRAAA